MAFSRRIRARRNDCGIRVKARAADAVAARSIRPRISGQLRTNIRISLLRQPSCLVIRRQSVAAGI